MTIKSFAKICYNRLHQDYRIIYYIHTTRNKKGENYSRKIFLFPILFDQFNIE